MIPLRDNLASRRRPFVNWSLIAINVAVFVRGLGDDSSRIAQLRELGLVPGRLTSPEVWSAIGVTDQLAPVVTHMFVHGSWLHLLGNLWFLHVFGDNVEGRIGHRRYLLFFVAMGIAGAAGQVVSAWSSPVPMVGASGAVSGVLGAYLLFFPRARVWVAVPLVVVPWTFEARAWLFLGGWGALQVVRGLISTDLGGGVAWWAHVAGFGAGFAAAGLWSARRRLRRYRR